MSTPPEPPAAVGLTVPGVRLDRVIGRGGFATVYGGTQQSLERPVAVKVDSRELHDERNRRRYLREVRAAGRITGHPHVVSLIDTGVLADSRPYIVMERCDGGSLADLVRRGPLPAADAVALVAAASSALGAAHRAGVLHRDVKPGNILLDSYGSPRLTDFGIASVEREGQDPSVTLESLTPDFACPEAFALAAPPRPEGDVWSMGAVLFCLLTGRGPRRAEDGSARSFAQIVQVLDRPVDLSSPLVPAAVRQVLGTAMHTDPGSRYPDGVALCDALTALSEQLGEQPGGGRVTVTGPGVALRLAQAAPTPPPGSDGPPARPLGAAGQAVAPGTGSPGAGTGVGAPPSRRRRALTAAAGAALVVGVLLGLGLGRLLWVDASATAAGSAVGGPTAGAAPASPGPAQASAPGSTSTPPHPVGVCLGGIVSVAGQASAQETSCHAAHYWEVFAVGTLDEETTGTSDEDLAADPRVQATCTLAAATAYGEPDPEVSVLGPNEVQWTVNGARGFSCVVSARQGGQRYQSYSGR
ncbi:MULTISPECIES: serine/threonine-protein kinase [unclassified Actinomyces]|uniref:serine/threonine-protein kinase n=1 Tax=unclassified Actinomyces TaxID=2609248 RepID=UPI002017E750|nr:MULTISPECIES: serine/threonine-protein kinase [unclassified Actinomyces]